MPQKKGGWSSSKGKLGGGKRRKIHNTEKPKKKKNVWIWEKGAV